MVIRKLEKFMKPNNNYRAYHLIKFHSINTFNTYTQSNIQAMFYERGIHTKQGIQFTKYYRENGYIRAFAHRQCMNELFPDYDTKFLKDAHYVGWDHYINGLFCHNNYLDLKLPITKGSSSIFRRIFFGRDSFEYVIDYDVQF